jgi:hypothetical protein
MSISLSNRIPFGKILIMLAAAFFIAVGLLWLDGILPYPLGPGHKDKFDFGVLGDIAGVVGLLSAAGFVATIGAWVGIGVIGTFSRKDAEPQRLFCEKHDKNMSK